MVKFTYFIRICGDLLFQGIKQQATGAQEHSASTFPWKTNTKSFWRKTTRHMKPAYCSLKPRYSLWDKERIDEPWDSVCTSPTAIVVHGHAHSVLAKQQFMIFCFFIGNLNIFRPHGLIFLVYFYFNSKPLYFTTALIFCWKSLYFVVNLYIFTPTWYFVEKVDIIRGFFTVI